MPSPCGSLQPGPFHPTRPSHRLLADFGGGKGTITISPRAESGKLHFQTSVSLWVLISTAALVDPFAVYEGQTPKPHYSKETFR